MEIWVADLGHSSLVAVDRNESVVSYRNAAFLICLPLDLGMCLRLCGWSCVSQAEPLSSLRNPGNPDTRRLLSWCHTSWHLLGTQVERWSPFTRPGSHLLLFKLTFSWGKIFIEFNSLIIFKSSGPARGHQVQARCCAAVTAVCGTCHLPDRSSWPPKSFL